MDDLAPKLRQERFAAYGPAPVPTPRASSSKRTESSDRSTEAASDSEEGSSRKKARNEGKKGNQKTKSVFRSFANPTNLAAPIPLTSTPGPSGTAPAMQAPKHLRSLSQVSAGSPDRDTFVVPGTPASMPPRYAQSGLNAHTQLAYQAYGQSPRTQATRAHQHAHYTVYHDMSPPSSHPAGAHQPDYSPSFTHGQAHYTPPPPSSNQYEPYATHQTAVNSTLDGMQGSTSFARSPSSSGITTFATYPYHHPAQSAGAFADQERAPGRERASSNSSSSARSQSSQQPLPSFRSSFPNVGSRGLSNGATTGTSFDARGRPYSDGRAYASIRNTPGQAPNLQIQQHQIAQTAVSPTSTMPSDMQLPRQHQDWPGAQVLSSETAGMHADSAVEVARSQLYDTNPKVAAGMRWSTSAQERLKLLERVQPSTRTQQSSTRLLASNGFGSPDRAMRGRGSDPFVPANQDPASPAKPNAEDAPVGSSAAEAEILSRKLQFAANAQRPSGGSRSGASEQGSGDPSERSSGFKKIALPFFRWFGATANTPGYRRIKVGVVSIASCR